MCMGGRDLHSFTGMGRFLGVLDPGGLGHGGGFGLPFSVCPRRRVLSCQDVEQVAQQARCGVSSSPRTKRSRIGSAKRPHRLPFSMRFSRMTYPFLLAVSPAGCTRIPKTCGPMFQGFLYVPSCAHTPSHLWNSGGRLARRNAGHLPHRIPPGERCRRLRRTLPLPSPPKSNRDPVERPNSRSVAVSILRRLKRPWRSIATPSAGNTCRKPRQ